MFRLAKLLYLVAVIGLLVVLSLVDQYAPALHANALRARLRGELLTLNALFVQQLELDQIRQARWTRRMASLLEADPAFASAQSEEAPDEQETGEDADGDSLDEDEADAPPGADAEGDPVVYDEDAGGAVAIPDDGDALDEALQAFPPEPTPSYDNAVRVAAERAEGETGRTVEAIRLIGADGATLATVGADMSWPDELPSAESELCGQPVGMAALIGAGDSVLIAACASVDGHDADPIASVLTARAVDVTAFASQHPDLAVDLTLFRHNGHILSTSAEDPEVMRITDRFIADLVAEEGLPTEATDTPRIAFVQEGAQLRALLAGWVPLDHDVGERPPAGFVLLLDAGRIPPDLARFVLANLASLRSSDRLGLIVGLGLALFALGVVLFEFEGRRYRSAISLLEYQLARREAHPERFERAPTGSEPAVALESAAMVTSATTTADGGAPEDDLRALFDAWITGRRECGEDVEDTNFEEFRAHLQRVGADVKARHGCRAVRFSTARVEGTVVVLAAPVR